MLIWTDSKNFVENDWFLETPTVYNVYKIESEI